MIIGIDDSHGQVYEGAGGDTHGAIALYPTPVVTPASFFSKEIGSFPLHRSASVSDVKCWLREDQFDLHISNIKIRHWSHLVLKAQHQSLIAVEMPLRQLLGVFILVKTIKRKTSDRRSKNYSRKRQEKTS